MMVIESMIGCLFGALLLPLAFFLIKDTSITRGGLVVGNLLAFAMALIIHGRISYDFYITTNWLHLSPQVNFHFKLNVDLFTRLTWVLITGLALLTHVFALWYMQSKRGKGRFHAMISLFAGIMLVVPAAENLLILFMAWELVGLMSYLLIGFENEKRSHVQAATHALWLNRLADVGFIIALGCFFKIFGTLELHPIKEFIMQPGFNLVEGDNYFMFHLGGLALLVAAMGKSAQYPFHTWLPEAMRGPAPASALLHAATMVVAGIILLLRLGSLLSEPVLMAALFVGLVSASWATIMAIVSLNFKKILAYSTIAQIGLMLAAIGAGAQLAAVYHLFTHAIYKAGLFFTAGYLLHAYHIPDDAPDSLLQLRGKGQEQPTMMICLGLLLMSLCGLPFSIGFFSKEMIAESVLFTLGNIAGWAGLAGKLMLFAIIMGTAIYSLKIFYIITEGTFSFRTHFIIRPLYAFLPILILSFGSLWLLFSFNPFSIHDSWMFGLSYIFGKPAPQYSWSIHAVGILLVTGLGLLIGIWFSRQKNIWANLHQLTGFIPELKTYYTLSFFTQMNALATIARNIDQHIIDKSLHFIANTHILIAHIVSFADRKLVDGLFRSIAISFYITGKGLRALHFTSARQMIYAVLLVLILLYMLFNLR